MPQEIMPPEDKIYEAPEFKKRKGEWVPTGFNIVLELNGVPDKYLFDKVLGVFVEERPHLKDDYFKINYVKNGCEGTINSQKKKNRFRFFNHVLSIIRIPTEIEIHALTSKGRTVTGTWALSAMKNLLKSKKYPNSEYDIELDVDILLADKLFDTQSEVDQYLTGLSANMPSHQCLAIIYFVNNQWQMSFIGNITDSMIAIKMLYFDDETFIIKDFLEQA